MTRVEQMHIPRFKMAEALRQQDHFFKSESYPEPIFATWMPFPTKVHGRNKLSYAVNRDTDLMLSESFVKKMKEDLPILETAKDRVRERAEDEYYLPRSKTAAGHPVESDSLRLMEAIAFEKLCVKRLTAGNFGIYSAFCTYRDFETSVKMPDELIAELISGQFEYSPQDIEEEVMRIFMDAQKAVLSQPIWGQGISIDQADAVKILSQGMASLTRTQRVQFILMNGMHAAGLFLPLATVTGVITYDQYAWYMCQGFQPDSPEEQERRTEIAYIQLYGELA